MHYNPQPGAPSPMPPGPSRPLPGRLSPWWVVGGTVVGGALIFGGLLAYSSYARAGATRGPGERPPGPGPGPGPTNGPPVGPGGGPPVPGPRIEPGTPGSWGEGNAPAGWDPESNQLYISPDCDLVLEGEKFEPDSKGAFAITAIVKPTLQETLDETPENSVYGYIDHLIEVEGYDAPETIALQVLVEANALCADIPPEQRPPALAAWFDDFVDRITPWVDDAINGIDFG